MTLKQARFPIGLRGYAVSCKMNFAFLFLMHEVYYGYYEWFRLDRTLDRKTFQ